PSAKPRIERVSYFPACSNPDIRRIHSGQLLGIEILGPKLRLLLRTHRTSQSHNVPTRLHGAFHPHLKLRSGHSAVIRIIQEESRLRADQRKPARKTEWIADSVILELSREDVAKVLVLRSRAHLEELRTVLDELGNIVQNGHRRQKPAERERIS